MNIALPAYLLSLLAAPQPPVITALTPSSPQVQTYRRWELGIALQAAYRNPFDTAEVAVDVRAEGPDGAVITVPAFAYQPFTRRLENDAEIVEPAGESSWLARLSFARPGRWTVRVSARVGEHTAESATIVVTVEPADHPGFIRRAATDARYFVDDRGDCFYPIGANVCWGNGPGTFSFDTWLPKYAANGANWFRVWLAPEWFTCGLQTRASGFDRIDLANAWRLDQVIEQAERLGLRVMPCIDSFNILRFKQNLYGQWEDSPYIAANGGPLAEPREYFTNPTMLDAYRDRLRYIVARWGYSPAVFAWEFWNEVDIIDQYDSEAVTAWHRDMARHLRELDPWDHLITTSHANPAGDPRLDVIPELDFVQSHRYGAQDMARQLGEDRRGKLAARDRPHFHGEFGISGDGRQTAERDPRGVHLRNGLFSSLGQEQAGTPMTWWWDSYIEPRNLYPLFGEFAAWLSGFDPVRQNARPVRARCVWSGPDADRPLEDVVLTPTIASWEPAPWNEPVTLTIARDGTITESAPLAHAMHGTVNHPALHNPATFEVDLEAPTTFVAIIHGVSGHGGSALAIAVDGREVLRREFVDDRPDDTETLTAYNGEYAVQVPAGRHAIRVENPGRDWHYLTYRLARAVRRAGPPLRAIGLVGDTAARIWVQNPEYTWPNATAPGFAPTTQRGAALEIEGLRPGRWRVTAGAGEATDVVVGADGLGRFELPAVTWDAALRWEWSGA